MGLSLNINQAQQDLIDAASLAMEDIKNGVFDNLSRETSALVAQASQVKKDAKYFDAPLQEGIDTAKQKPMSVSESSISFEYGIDQQGGSDPVRKQVIWGVLTEGNLHNPSSPNMNSHFTGGHTYSKPGQQVWTKGIQEQELSRAKTSREIPHWDYGGTGQDYEGITHNAVVQACGSDPTFQKARDTIAAYMNNLLILKISVS